MANIWNIRRHPRNNEVCIAIEDLLDGIHAFPIEIANIVKRMKENGFDIEAEVRKQKLQSYACFFMELKRPYKILNSMIEKLPCPERLEKSAEVAEDEKGRMIKEIYSYINVLLDKLAVVLLTTLEEGLRSHLVGQGYRSSDVRNVIEADFEGGITHGTKNGLIMGYVQAGSLYSSRSPLVRQTKVNVNISSNFPSINDQRHYSEPDIEAVGKKMKEVSIHRF